MIEADSQIFHRSLATNCRRVSIMGLVISQWV